MSTSYLVYPGIATGVGSHATPALRLIQQTKSSTLRLEVCSCTPSNSTANKHHIPGCCGSCSLTAKLPLPGERFGGRWSEVEIQRDHAVDKDTGRIKTELKLAGASIGT